MGGHPAFLVTVWMDGSAHWPSGHDDLERSTFLFVSLCLGALVFHPSLSPRRFGVRVKAVIIPRIV